MLKCSFWPENVNPIITRPKYLSYSLIATFTTKQLVTYFDLLYHNRNHCFI